jgi:hypothetical protein
MDARSLMSLSRSSLPGMTSLSGYTRGGGMSPEEFQRGAAEVTTDDLREIGVSSVLREPFNAAGTKNVDPEAMKFDAMMALKRAQQQGMPTQFAEKRLQDAEMFKAGRDEVLRRRQKDFNEAAAAPQASDTYGEAYNYMRPDQKIAGLTGAAIASQARTGRFGALPRETHDPIYRTQSHLAGIGGPPEDMSPYMLSGLSRAKGRGY